MVIAISGRIAANGLYAMREGRRPDIAQRHAAASIDIFQVFQKVTAAAARADHAILHLVVGGFHFPDEGTGGHSRDRTGSLDQVAAGEIVLLCHTEYSD